MNRYVLLPLILLLTTLLTTIHSQEDTACTEMMGQFQREQYFSSLLGQQMWYSVYTPPCYNPATTYPVLYLMHGSNDDDGQWQRLGLGDVLDQAISSGERPSFITVMPFGNVIANRNRFDNQSWGNIFMTELIPDVEAKYPIAQDRERRAIGGISRGGFWAYQIGLTHPDLFSAIGGHSAFFDPNNAPPEFNPLDLATQPTGQPIRLWLDRGKDDFAAPGLDLMSDRLAAAGVPHEYVIYPEGQHINPYWASHLNDYLQFYTSAWQPSPNPPGAFATNTPLAPMPTQTPMPTTGSSVPNTLYFPVVGFPSLQTTISNDQLQAIADGQYDENLILDQGTLDALLRAGFTLHPDTHVVTSETLRNTLWRNRGFYTLLSIEAITLDYRILLVDDRPITEQFDTYPFATVSNVPNFDPALLTRITASGVTALTRNTLKALDANGLDWAASGIQDYVTASDFFHISNEVSMTTTCPQTTGELLGGSSSFCSSPAHFALFDLLDVDMIELTGNHNNDYGYDAYRDTLAFYQTVGYQTIGGGETLEAAQKPVIIQHNNNIIAWIACNAAGPYYAQVNEDPALAGGIRPGAAPCDFDWLETIIPEIEKQVDLLIVSVQHDEVEDYQPTAKQVADFRYFIQLGVDIVLGTAPHKPQTFEFYPQDGTISLIHYGLGNLYFDQPYWGNTRFFLDTFYIYDGQLHGIEIFPGIIEYFGRPRLMTPDERLNFLFFMFNEQNGL